MQRPLVQLDRQKFPQKVTVGELASAFSLGRKASAVSVLGFFEDEVEQREQETDRVLCQRNCAQPRMQSYC